MIDLHCPPLSGIDDGPGNNGVEIMGSDPFSPDDCVNYGQILEAPGALILMRSHQDAMSSRCDTIKEWIYHAYNTGY